MRVFLVIANVALILAIVYAARIASYGNYEANQFIVVAVVILAAMNLGWLLFRPAGRVVRLTRLWFDAKERELQGRASSSDASESRKPR